MSVCTRCLANILGELTSGPEVANCCDAATHGHWNRCPCDPEAPCAFLTAVLEVIPGSGYDGDIGYGLLKSGAAHASTSVMQWFVDRIPSMQEVMALKPTDSYTKAFLVQTPTVILMTELLELLNRPDSNKESLAGIFAVALNSKSEQLTTCDDLDVLVRTAAIAYASDAVLDALTDNFAAVYANCSVPFEAGLEWSTIRGAYGMYTLLRLISERMETGPKLYLVSYFARCWGAFHMSELAPFDPAVYFKEHPSIARICSFAAWTLVGYRPTNFVLFPNFEASKLQETWMDCSYVDIEHRVFGDDE